MKRLLEVLNIINKYAPDAYISAEHDEIYIGKAKPEFTLGKEDANRLEGLRVYWVEDLDAWRMFV